MRYLRFSLMLLAAWTLILGPQSRAFAQVLPGGGHLPSSADVGRVDEHGRPVQEPPALPPAPEVKNMPGSTAPEGSNSVVLTLKTMHIDGMTAFTEDQVKDIYGPYLGKKITLDMLWVFAQQLTDRYHKAGYFLSRAYVPAQDATDGNITLKVAEGFVDEVSIDGDAADNSIVQGWVEKLQSYRPITTRELENVLLQLNALPGVHFRSVIEPVAAKEAPDGAVKLTLDMIHDPGTGHIAFDNSESKYLGPYEASAQYEQSFIPFEKTSISGLTSLPTKKLNYGNITQTIPVIPGGAVDLFASYTKAQPGYTLTPEEIDSNSIGLGVGFTYQWLKLRQESLSTRIGFESRDTAADILQDTPLTRDAIRALRANVSYERTDKWDGDNSVSMTLSQGLPILGASESGAPDLSRAQATPDFSKLEFYMTRLQALPQEFSAMAAVSGQAASGPLYSSEEFGYGGQAFGRAYDESEITGDQGIAASLELRYNGLHEWAGITPMPYTFYDVGTVWNYDRTQEKEASGSSFGGGVRGTTEIGISGDLGIALPLSRNEATPIYGGGRSPRYLMSLSYGF
jgi:hemolysin activation/secretion protein